MREYLSRAVNKAIGAHSAPVVTPNQRPVFPPTGSETGPASLDSQGDVIFRSTAPAASPSVTPTRPLVANMSTEADMPVTISPSMQHGHEEVSTPRLREERATTILPPTNFHSTNTSYELPELPGDSVENQRAARLAAQPAAVDTMHVMDTSMRVEGPHSRSSQEIPNSEVSAIESRNLRDDQIAPQEIEPGSREEQRERAEGIQTAPRQTFVREDSHTAKEERVVQVRIGRVEVRVAAPVPAVAPATVRPRGPRGFAEYESIRRYVTRNRM